MGSSRGEKSLGKLETSRYEKTEIKIETDENEIPVHIAKFMVDEH